MIRPSRLLPATLTLLLTSAAAQEPKTAPPAEPQAGADATARAHDAFALALYRRLATGSGNLFLAPGTARAALAMAWAGARGTTASEMAEVLRLPAAGDAAHRQVAQLAAGLQPAGDEASWSLRTAQRLFGKQGTAFRAAFLATCRRHYDAGLERVDFAGATEQARRTINAWAHDATGGHVPELLQRGELSPNTTLVLCSAITFAGDWARPFEAEQTKPRPFHVRPAGGRAARAKAVDVPTMHRRTRNLHYAADDAVQVVELPYAGERIGMLLVVPRERFGLAAVESTLTPETVAAWSEALEPRDVDLLLPRFTLRTTRKLDPELRQMGMQLAFDAERADFAGITAEELPLYIGPVIHGARVEVDETGTEAAGATAVVMAPTGMPHFIDVHADHPFLFLIRDLDSGAILFAGRVTDPTAT